MSQILFNFFNEINEKTKFNLTKLMLEYSTHLLELSSIQKFVKISEYRVLDTRPWNHYFLHNVKNKEDFYN